MTSFGMSNGYPDGLFSYHSPRSSLLCNSPKKRRLEECLAEKENKSVQFARSRDTFLRVPGCDYVFHSEDYKTGSRQSTLYLPVHGDLLINLTNIEQISFSSGVSFLADDEGIYCRSAQGHAINLWRFDNNTRKLYISRALFFTDPEVKFNCLSFVLFLHKCMENNIRY
ncbi:hypothetical protein NP493_465g01028 [Ridgeia piscesae]|uniref:Uncharacterized protein n=1 Tax=Ridgeia piscesae TaxID=27915 RepID=A0AAD9KYT6_RIDPI|nr:hypothetical protein NP493_465g01028 [Ridgeia piscesae]